MPLDDRFRFENFVTGAANRLAVAAARAVAESPGAVYTPLFIYSDSGLGKTHLLMAIGSQVRHLHPDLGVEYVVLDDFVDELHAAVESSQVDRFRARFQELDVLLLDDVQFLTGRPETQAELLRLFNALHGRGAQIVMSSDRPPTEIADVEERLVTRLAGGLIVDIGPPDMETRLAIVRARSAERGVTFLPGVEEALSAMEVTSVRELQGALNRLIAHQALGERIIEPAEVPSILGVAEAPASPPVRPSQTDFESFLADVVTVVTEQVDSWRTRVGESIARWSSAGFRTEPLETLLEEELPPHNWEAVVRGFSAIAERLRSLEEQATALDPSYAGAELFRDVERVSDAERLLQSLLAAATPAPGPSAAFVRADLEVGQSNQLAVRAADTVSAEPGKRYNPLFMHGPSGVGKTHLAHALGNEVAARREGSRVAVVSAQSFMDELVDSLQSGSISRWRARYRGVDALVVDDVQFVAGKERTQEELFHVFNALYAEGKQLVFVSDRPPKELEGLEERLRSRFEGGLVVAIQPPDPALRERLYTRFLTTAGQTPPQELIKWLARRPAESVRDIQGVVSRLLAASDLGAHPISLALARKELDGRHSVPRSLMPLAAGSSDSFFIDDEKVVWEWPDLSDRLIEEVR